MATSASEKLQMTILKCCRYMGVEWDMSLHEFDADEDDEDDD